MSLAGQPPLPPPPILTPPTGWLGFLGLKSGGTQPNLTAGFLQPLMEMFPFYMAGARAPLVSAVVVAAPTASPALIATVPAGKAWIVEQSQAVGIQGVAPAVGQAEMIYTRASGDVIYRGPPDGAASLAAAQVLVARSDRVVVLGSGDRIMVYLSAGNAFTAFNFICGAMGVEVSA